MCYRAGNNTHSIDNRCVTGYRAGNNTHSIDNRCVTGPEIILIALTTDVLQVTGPEIILFVSVRASFSPDISQAGAVKGLMFHLL